MPRWKVLTLVNTCFVAGAGISIFVLPPETPVWLWAIGAVLFAVALNLIVLGRLRAREGSKTRPIVSTLVIIGTFLILVAELVLRLRKS